MAQPQQQQTTKLPAGMHIESGWSDLKIREELEKKKKEQAQDPRHNQE